MGFRAIVPQRIIPCVRALVSYLVAATLFLAAQPLQAQLHVRIETSGQPVAGARIELWTPTARIAERLSDAQGLATFPAVDIANATSVIARRIGFRPERAELPAGATTLRIALVPLAAPLPTVTVREADLVCPQQDDAAARRRWEDARSTYTPSFFGRHSVRETSTGTVTAEEIGDVSKMRLNRGSRSYTTAGMAGARGNLSAHGYVRRLPERHTDTDFGIWSYPALAREYAEHFAEATFGERHTLRIVAMDSASQSSTLSFCARDRRQSGLDGVLRIGADGSLTSARWRFWNPARGAELAGGEVVFTPRDARGTPAPLLAAQGLFWRRLPGGLFYQRWEQYSLWRLTPE